MPLRFKWTNFAVSVLFLVHRTTHHETPNQVQEKWIQTKKITLKITNCDITYHIASSASNMSLEQWRRDEFENEGHNSGAKPRKFLLLWPCNFVALYKYNSLCSVSCLLFFYLRCPPPRLVGRRWSRVNEWVVFWTTRYMWPTERRTTSFNHGNRVQQVILINRHWSIAPITISTI